MTNTNASAADHTALLQEYSRIVEQLPEDLSQPFIMAYVRHMPMPAISAALGISSVELSNRLTRALIHCLQALEHNAAFESFVDHIPTAAVLTPEGAAALYRSHMSASIQEAAANGHRDACPSRAENCRTNDPDPHS